MDNTDERLKLFIERVERLESEIKDIQADRKDVYSEAKSLGFDVPAMKATVKLRKLKRDDRIYQDQMLETYKAAMGID